MLRTPVEGKSGEGASQATTATQAPVKTTARPAGEPAPPRVFRIEALIGTCHSYHPDGPVIAQLKAGTARQG